MSVTAFRTDLDTLDFFCGIGGSSSGLVRAGWQVKLAANHDKTAIATHSANHPDTEHICADLQAVDFRYLPKTRALWASPICTEVSPAGGKKKQQTQGGPSLFEEHGHVPDAAFERTRVTFWEVLRAAEVHRYEVIMLENVLEAFDWELLPTFLSGLETLGYEIQILCVSAAHVGGEDNPNAPQLRDRIYWVARRRGMKPFDLDPRPASWCDTCGVVEGVQWWKPLNPKSRTWKGQRAGKYGQQYLYVCPAGHGRVEPLIMPAAAAIDWTDLGTRIGDRAELGMRDLAASTLRRVAMGLEMISNPALIAAAGNTYDAASGSGNRYLRATDPHGWPTPAQMGTAQQALVSAGFTTPVGGTWRTDADRLDAPMKTRTTSETDALVLAPKFVMAVNHDSGPRAFDPDFGALPTRSTKNGEALVMAEPFVAMLRNHGKPTRIGQPLATIAAGGFHHGLVVPFRKGARPHSPGEPLSTMATHAQHGIMAAQAKVDVEDCYFRMLSPRESANAQRFDRDYILTGTLGEQQLGAGNAVAVNVAQMIGTRVAEGLDAA